MKSKARPWCKKRKLLCITPRRRSKEINRSKSPCVASKIFQVFPHIFPPKAQMPYLTLSRWWKTLSTVFTRCIHTHCCIQQMYKKSPFETHLAFKINSWFFTHLLNTAEFEYSVWIQCCCGEYILVNTNVTHAAVRSCSTSIDKEMFYNVRLGCKRGSITPAWAVFSLSILAGT